MTPEQLTELATDIDLRLMDTWATIMDCEAVLGTLLEDDEVRESFSCLLRVAYGRGYMDALNEAAEGTPGLLCQAHGYRNPLD